jgi:hypothetical protein
MDKQMKIEFLGMKEGCPNTPKMWHSLQKAMQELRWSIPVDSLDLMKLSEEKDLRAGYGSPTILVNGKDLFDASLPTKFDAACRYYEGGVPGRKRIFEKLKVLKR